MSNRRNWFVSTVVLSLLWSYQNFFISAQSQNAIGAHRTFQKTSFSCVGRGAGYYADIETGCQVYHMCDGLGRQFSYSCPNTTLFQQRMLICDHWYMVNCSKAESDYTANLLIGQRDKPFVNEEENNLRTPRPDLLDRPYAPDYSGESFRNQYQKSLSSILNQIYDADAQKNRAKGSQAPSQPSQPAGQQRWKIPPPSRIILPPAYEPQIQDDMASTTTKPTTRSSYYKPTTNTATTTLRPPTLRSTTANSRSQGTRFSGVAALHNRHDEHLQYEHDDLGTSHSTRYNTSADFNSAEDNKAKNRQQKSDQRKNSSGTKTTFGLTTARPKTTTMTTTTASPNIKIPSKIYEPPMLYPIYNLDDTSSSSTTTTTTVRPLFKASTASPFVTRHTTTTSSATTRAPSRATTVVGKPFTRSSASTTTTHSGRNLNVVNRFDADKLSKEIRTPAAAQGFKAPTPRPPTRTTNTSLSYNDNVPSKHLLPPLTDFVQHDVATTQGPPIYYEWKVPSDGLEPPKKESPIGVDGRQYPDTITDYNSISASGSFSPATNNFGIDQKKEVDTKQISRTPTSRSIKETGQPNGVAERRPKTTSPAKPQTPVGTSTPANLEDIFQIRKELSVPEYAFPLENAGRTGYLATDVYNSFQLKIPERRSDTDEHLHWYGENPKCPQCHPSYVIPGTCEPCLRR